MSAANADILKKIVNNFQAVFIYFLYDLVLAIAFPIVSFYFLGRIRKDRRYARYFSERLGRLPFSPDVTPAPSIWFHAVSVGEVLSAGELIRRLRREYPAAPTYLSVATVAGRELAENKLARDVDAIFYAPIDYPRIVRRVMRKLRPALVVVLETEIWPSMYREAKRNGAGLIIVNARISDRAFPRYRRIRPLVKAVLSCPDRILIQSERDRNRYLELGAPPERLAIGGNLKYDFSPPAEVAPAIRTFLDRTAPGRIWIAASTMPPADASDIDEDDVVLGAFLDLRSKHPDLLFVHVPRRPERFDVVAGKLDAAGIPYVRRSILREDTRLRLPGVLLLDTIGELSALFRVASVVFMGGTLAHRGGHNILEPAFFGKPVIVGPHMENFSAIADEFRSAGALIAIDGPTDLAPAISEFLDDGLSRDRVGEAAQHLAASKRGVTGVAVSEILDLYFRSIPFRKGPAGLAPFSAIWRVETNRRRAKALASQRALDKRVVSIGNLSAGGAGKTPLVAWLARQARAEGVVPCILTRGYGRRSPEPSLVIPAAASFSSEITGDEAWILLRRGDAALGIGGDRYRAGTLVQQTLPADLFILDDGFQHWRLHRDLDVVVIDALDPFDSFEVIPRGRLREPLDVLARAGAFVITRLEPGIRTDAVEHFIRLYNPIAPVFRSSVVARRVVNLGTGEPCVIKAAPFSSAIAFCGLGNPASFWRTLAKVPFQVKFRWPFADHHRYRPDELRRLRARTTHVGAEALITTEKDAANLPADALELLAPYPVYYVEIEAELEDAEAFVKLCLG